MTNGWSSDLLLGGIVLAGASVQRMSGMGFALVAVPALVLLLGPAHGVLLANFASAVICAVGLAVCWRQVRLPTMVPLVVAALCAVPLGDWAAARLPEPVLLAGMGLLVTAAVLLVMRGARLPSLRGRGGALAAGAASGFMNSAAGVGGPALSLYAVNAGWTVEEFVPNAQFSGVVVNALSIAARGVPRLAEPVWLLFMVALGGGVVIGQALAKRVPEKWARRVVLALALAGGLTTMGKGLLAL